MRKFVNCKSMELLATTEAGSIDLVLTDPPYIISKKSGFKSVKRGVQRFAVDTDFGTWDKTFTMHDLHQNCSEYFRVLRKGGTAIVFCDIWKISQVKSMFEDIGFKQIRIIIWEKTNPVPLNSSRNYLTNSREVAILGVKKSKPTFNSQYDNGVYRFPICQDKGRFHKTQKPLLFMTELIIKHSNPGDTVMDTFAGSATTLMAAYNISRHYVGCESDINFYTKACARLSEIQV